MHDLNGREIAAAIPLLILMVWMGVYTKSFLPMISAANARILEQSKQGVEFKVENRKGGNVAQLGEIANGR
jgi:NADH:ubiquinone oxidoreductase subunit 4 (subunit M)